VDFINTEIEANTANTVDALFSKLQIQFGDKTSILAYRRLVTNAKQQTNETLIEFGNRIKNLNHKTFLLTNIADQNEIIIQEADTRALGAFLQGRTTDIANLFKAKLTTSFQQARDTAV
jgi:hypothetical protein